MKKCTICSTATGVYDKIYATIFAKKIAEEEAAARRKTAITVAICVVAGVVAVAAAAVAAVIVIKKKFPELSIKEKAVSIKDSVVEKVKAKLPKKEKADDCDCDFECDCDIECEVCSADDAAEEAAE